MLGATIDVATTYTQAQYDALKNEIKLLNGQLLDLQRRYDIQVQQLQTLSLTTQERDQALAEIARLKLQIDALTVQLKTAITDLERLKAQDSLIIKDLETKISNLQTLYNAQVQQFKELVAQNAITVQERDLALKELSDLKVRIQELTSELNALKSKLTTATSENTNLLSKIESLNAQISICENKGATSLATISDLTKKLLDVTNSYNTLTEVSTEDARILKQKINELSQRIIELESLNQSTKTSLDSKEAQIQSLNLNIQRLNAILQSNKVDTQSLSELMSNNNALNNQLTNIKALYAQLQSSTSLTAEENARLLAQISDLNSKISSLQSSENALRVSKAQEVEELNRQVRNCQANIPRMTTGQDDLKLLEQENKIKSLQAENESLKQELQGMSSSQFANTNDTPSFANTEHKNQFPWLWIVVSSVVVGTSVYVISNKKNK
jgi:chromosome segregation ATPase